MCQFHINLMSFLRETLIYLPEIQPEAMGSKISMIKINSYKFNVFLGNNYHIFTKNTARGQGQKDWYDQDKSNVFLKSNYHIFTIMISLDNLSYALIKTSLSATMWSDQSGKIRVSTFSWCYGHLSVVQLMDQLNNTLDVLLVARALPMPCVLSAGNIIPPHNLKDWLCLNVWFLAAMELSMLIQKRLNGTKYGLQTRYALKSQSLTLLARCFFA